MPKRLLQYVLSRLEILDTDALDLENLDIAWGKNSTFEFRDVGLRLRVTVLDFQNNSQAKANLSVLLEIGEPSSAAPVVRARQSPRPTPPSYYPSRCL